MRTPLSEQALNEALGELPHWERAADALTRTFRFASFREAISFLVRVAFVAEELNHHPEIANVYNRVTLTLTTHDAGNKVTSRDVELAKKIDHFCWVD
ncbi:MAG: 4a-hydroxytetrahydrobiopterin dehydratase [Myxococcales bacterium]|nr:4a-hydroxytetrahydrobiopterin dehydratase [Myxococcales bacterium]